jgi:DNA sulfur modification protein DndE
MIETIRLSTRAKQQLVTLKRRTGLQHWNVLCRWAFCISLSEPSKPPPEDIPGDSSVEMSWKTFSGRSDDVYWALLVARAKRDGVDLASASLGAYFRLHLHRGISYLANRVTDDISDLFELAVPSSTSKLPPSARPQPQPTR